MWWNRSDSVDVLPTEDFPLSDEGEAPEFLSVPPTDGDEVDREAVVAQLPKRDVNARFFFASLAVLALLLVGGHFLHAYQMQRISSVFLTSARKAAEADEPSDAIRYIRQYLNFHPRDLEARILLADQLAQVAETPRQILNLTGIYEGILRADPENFAIREKLVDWYLDSGRHRDALTHLASLTNRDPQNPDFLLKTAECHEAIGEADKAASTYRDLIRQNPRDARLYERLAFLLREELDRPEAADQLIQELMDSNQRNALAYGVRARYRHRFGELKHAMRDARIAYQLDPHNPEILKLVARLLTDQLAAGQEPDYLPTAIRADLQAFLEENPEDRSAAKALVDLDLADGRSQEAEERLRKLLKADPRDVSTRFQLADLLLVTGRTQEAQEEIERIRRMGVTWAALEFLEARILIVQEEWLKAIHTLERISINPRQDAELASSVAVQLGQCYEQIGHHHRRLEAFREAVQVNGQSLEAHLGLAAALARLGRVDEALSHYQKIDGVPEVSLAVARLHLIEQLMLPPAERTWEQVESALVEAAQDKANPDETLRLRVLGLVAQNQIDLARRRLEQQRNQRPDSLPVWLLSAQLENWANKPEAAEDILKTAEQELGSSAELTLAQLRLKTRKPESSNADWVLSQLESWDNLPENFRLPVLKELTEGVEASQKNPEEALELRLKMASLKPDDLRVWRRVLPVALAAKNDEAARKAVREIRRIEGDLGPYWRLAEADRCLMLARQGQKEYDAKARKLLKNLRNELPADWTIPLRLAEIAERRNETDRAIEHYKDILQLEMYHPQVVRRLITLLSSKGRDSEAEGYLIKMQKSRPRSFGSRYGRVAAVVALRSQHRGRALELAKEAVAEDSQNPEDHLWLGQILLALGMHQQAEDALRSSLRLDPKQTSARVALIRLLKQTDRHEKALEEIGELQAHVPPEEAGLPLAYCLEITGQADAAYQAYRDLAESEPRNGYLRWIWAKYCRRSERLEEAKAILRSLLEESPKWDNTPTAAVRRSLVRCLMQNPSYQTREKALAMIDASLAGDPNSVPDLRMKAHLLAERPFRRDRLKALAVFDQLRDLAPLSKVDRIQRVQLLEGLDRKSAAKEAVAELLSLHQEDPNVLAFGIRHRIEWGEVTDTTRGWLAQLEQKSPGEFSTISLQARFLVAKGKTGEAVKTLENWRGQETEDAEARLARLEQSVRALVQMTEQQDRLGQAGMAEALSAAAERSLAELIEQKPERLTWKIRYLTGRWQLEEAWDLLDRTWEVAPPEDVASVLISLLQKSRPDQRRFDRVRGPLENALDRNPDSLQLALSAGSIAQLCGEYDLAISLYRSVLEKNPEVVAAQNELAVLLALLGRSSNYAQALEWIDRAIEKVGPLHFLLDTKATVLLAMNRPGEAVRLLNQAIADTPSPAKYYHLIEARLALEEPDEARRVYQTALAEGFSPRKLHPLEQSAAETLKKRLRKN